MSGQGGHVVGIGARMQATTSSVTTENLWGGFFSGTTRGAKRGAALRAIVRTG
jgi:hypothetical protein